MESAVTFGGDGGRSGRGPTSICTTREELLAAASRARGGDRLGIVDLQVLVKDLGRPDLAARVANLKRGRRVEAHPDVELVAEVVTTIETAAATGQRQDDSSSTIDCSKSAGSDSIEDSLADGLNMWRAEDTISDNLTDAGIACVQYSSAEDDTSKVVCPDSGSGVTITNVVTRTTHHAEDAIVDPTGNVLGHEEGTFEHDGPLPNGADPSDASTMLLSMPSVPVDEASADTCSQNAQNNNDDYGHAAMTAGLDEAGLAIDRRAKELLDGALFRAANGYEPKPSHPAVDAAFVARLEVEHQRAKELYEQACLKASNCRGS